MTSFDLVDRPWLPVIGPRGPEELSLRDVFRRAPELTDLTLPFVPERVAVTRILVAVLQAAMRGPEDDEARAEWIAGHGEVVTEVDDYLDEWHDRFDLFDPGRPFMQRPVDEAMARDVTVAALRLDWASGNNATLFDHHVDERPPALDPGPAARALLTTLHFQPGGGVSKPFNRTDSPGTKAVAVLVQGRTLWQTLVANSATPPEGDRPEAFGVPIWERPETDDDGSGVTPDHEPDRDGTAPQGWLDRLTWRSRAIQLLPDADGLVRRCRIHQHLKLRDGGVEDPFSAVRYDDAGQAELVRMRPGKRLWRSADEALRGVSDRSRSAAAQGVRSVTLAGLPHPQLLVAGLQVNQAKIAEAQGALLPVSDALLGDEQRLDWVRELLEDADQGGVALRNACLTYLDVSGAERDFRVADQWQVSYWAALGQRFPLALADLAADETDLDAYADLRRAWGDEVRVGAKAALDQQHRIDAADPRTLEALARSRASFLRHIKPVPTTRQETTA